MAESIKPLVIDASIVLNHLFPDELSDDTDSLFKDLTCGKVKFISTTLLPFEVANGLRSGVLRKRVDKDTAINLMNSFLKYKMDLVSVDYRKVLSLSLDESITVYDASYLYLSQKENIPLLTLDVGLKKLSIK